MTKTQKDKDKDEYRQSLINIGYSALFIIVLTVFCKSVGYSLIIPLFIFFLGFHLILSDKRDVKIIVHLGLLLALLLFATHTIHTYTAISPYWIPVAAFPMLTMLLWNSRTLAFVMALASSVIASLILGGSFIMMLIFFLGGLAGAYSVREARRRAQLISAGLFVSIIQTICLFLFFPEIRFFVEKSFLDMSLIPLAVNGFLSAFIVAATLKVFEFLFGVLTNFSLLELSDFNQPLLKRMILEAPGTYHHSLVVSNLAESAADAIGAHSLLTRVGAYYHDIGKMVKPEYFTENQMMGAANAHDKIEPSMSRLVILNHVKEGLEMAKKNNLNKAIIDFIPQHHGTSLIYYFYQKSIEEAGEGSEVTEETFRYPGPKPQTRETAITLLADSVEGATRALDEPSHTNIEETVQKVVNNKFIDGQLDECPLTLKEIDKISSTFIRVLTAMYHGRVKYPEKKEKNGHSSKKSSEKNNTKSSSNNSDSKDNPST